MSYHRSGVDQGIAMVATAAAARMSGRWAALLAANLVWRGLWLVVAFVAIGSGQAGLWIALVVADAAWAVVAHAHGRADARRQLDVYERAATVTLPDAMRLQLDKELTVAAGHRSPAGHRVQYALVAIVSPLEALAYWAGWRTGRDGTTARELFERRPAAQPVPAAAPSAAPIAETRPAAGIDPATPTVPATMPPLHRAGGIVGLDDDGELTRVAARQALLVIGPPGTGKSSGIVLPNTAVAPGPVVSTSLKLEVLLGTKAERAPLGTLWVFDPGGDSVGRIDGITHVRWSPLEAVHDWDSAKRIAASMRYGAAAAARMTNSGTGNGGTDHFERRAASWLAVMLYAASFVGVESLIDWLTAPRARSTTDGITKALSGAPAESPDLRIARGNLTGLLEGTDTEVANIASTLANITDLYSTTGGRATALAANFDPDAFVRSGADSLYVVVPTEDVTLYAPLTVALLDEVFHAQASRYRIAEIEGTAQEIQYVTMVLDEAANIAPIDAPRWVSQAGGQGIHLIYALQDLSQARAQFGPEVGQGLMSMFPHKVLLPGIQDRATTETVSLHVGQMDQPDVSYSTGTGGGSTSIGSRRIDRLPPDQIARLPRGTALYLDGADHHSLTALRWHDPQSKAAIAAAIARGE